MGSADPTTGVVVGEQALRMTRRQWLILGACLIASVVAGLLAHIRWTSYIFALILLGNVVRALPPRMIASAAGVSRPWRRHSFIAWPDVASVDPGDAARSYPALVMRTGKVLGLSGMKASQAFAVAEVGGKPVRSVNPARPAGRSAPAADRPPTDQQRAADVRRRAELLAAERARDFGRYPPGSGPR